MFSVFYVEALPATVLICTDSPDSSFRLISVIDLVHFFGGGGKNNLKTINILKLL